MLDPSSIILISAGRIEFFSLVGLFSPRSVLRNVARRALGGKNLCEVWIIDLAELVRGSSIF